MKQNKGETMLDFLRDNMDLVLGVATILVPALLPARFATKINLVTKVLRGATTVLEKLDNSKGGLTLEPEVVKTVKQEAKEKLAEVIASKTERFDSQDVSEIISLVAKSKGVDKIANKLMTFTRGL